MSRNTFLEASRKKLRFPSAQGRLSVEDLWDVPLKSRSSNKASIENIGASLLARQRALTEAQVSSILEDASPSSELEEVNLQVAILREVATLRQAENKAKTEAQAKFAERRRLEELIREREGKELPLEDLKAQLASLSE